MNRYILFLLLLLTACAPLAEPAITPQLIKIHASASTQPWLAVTYDCADGLGLIVFNTNDPRQAELSIRMGEPGQLTSPAYQIGRQDLLVVTNRESPLGSLAAADVRKLFSQPEPAEVEIWVFAAGEDIQQVFAQDVLEGQRITSLARLAVNPAQMSDGLARDKKGLGLLPRWKAGALRELFSLPNVPVLAILKSEPHGSLKDLLVCLQKHSGSTP